MKYQRIYISLQFKFTSNESKSKHFKSVTYTRWICMFLCLYINQNQTGSCSSLLYTCMIKHHDYPSLHKAWKGCFKVILLYHRYTMLFQNIQIQDRDKFHYPILEVVSVNYLYTFKWFISKYIRKSNTPCCQTIGRMPQ